MVDPNPLAFVSPSLVPPARADHPSSSVDHKCQGIARDFESVLLSRLFEQVQQTMGNWDQPEDGAAPQVQGLFWLYLAREVADQGGIGLWKEIYRGIEQMAGVPNPAAALDEEL